MGRLIYDLGIWVYSIVIYVVSPFNRKAKTFLKGRKNLFQQIAVRLKDNNKPVAWFHCASLGEFEQARPVIEAFKEKYPTYFILLTFFSPSGYEVRKNYPQADLITYLPIDTASNAKKYIEITKPAIAFFVKYEFWFHYLNQLNAKQIPVISFSTIFRKDQIYFKSYGGFHANILRLFSFILVQDPQSEALVKSLDIEKVTIGGDTRFDRVKSIVDAKKDIEIAQKFKHDTLTLVVGSSWPPDIDLIASFYLSFTGKLKLIIAPHEIEEQKLQKTEAAFPQKKIIRFSKAANQDLSAFDILIIDNIGMLSSLYQYGEFAYIGGAFGTGLHNTLEAATYGIPIFFGPEYSKFKEAIDLVKIKGAYSVENSEAFTRRFADLFKDAEGRQKIGEICKTYVMKNTGGTQKVMDLCKAYLP